MVENLFEEFVRLTDAVIASDAASSRQAFQDLDDFVLENRQDIAKALASFSRKEPEQSRQR